MLAAQRSRSGECVGKVPAIVERSLVAVPPIAVVRTGRHIWVFAASLAATETPSAHRGARVGWDSRTRRIAAGCAWVGCRDVTAGWTTTVAVPAAEGSKAAPCSGWDL